MDKATRPVVELLENRQLLSAALSVSSSLMVFNAVAGSGTPSQTETLTLTNTGDAPLTLGSGSITFVNEGAGSIPFTELNAGSIPISLASGQSFGLQLNYTATAVQTDAALLDISTNDPINTVAQITLHGIGTKGLGGSNQPSLATILQAYEIPTLVGEGPNDANAATDSVYPYPPDPSTQEVVLQRLVKAGAGPVTIQVLASFTASGTKPYTLGTYAPGNPNDRTELFFTPSGESQSTYVQPQGITSFDPGASQFGFYCVSNVQVTGRLIFSEDALNTFDSTTGRHFRFFPMENPDGSVQPNTYIMTSTEWNAPIGYDFTNIVAIVRNVKAANGAPDGPVMGLQDLNALPASSNMIFNRIQSPNTSIGDIVHDTGTLQVNNTGDQPLTVNSYMLSSAWKLINNPPTFPLTIAPQGKLDLSIQFVATGEPSHPYNETNGPLYTNGGGVYNGAITLNGNDPNTPVATYQLRGWWQLHSENENEPSLQTITNLLAGYTTNINPSPIPDLTESSLTGATPTYYGEEVVSAYWQEVDPGQPVSVTQVDSYHTEGTSVITYWYPKGGSSNKMFTTVADTGQTMYPTLLGTTTPASGTFNSTGTFGFRIDNEFSDDAKNALKTGGGHHIRFYPVRDATGDLVPNTYLMALDYSASPENFDFQDNVYIVSNIKPAIVNTGIAAPQTTGAPATPTDLGAISSNGINTLQWGSVAEKTLVGYKVYSATAQAGPYILLTPTPIAAITYTDYTAPHTGNSYYKVTAFDSNSTESLGVQTSVLDTGSTPGAPVAAPETASTPFETAVIISVFPDATDNANGTLLASTVAVTAPAGHGQTLVNPTNGAITYTPAAGFSGIDTFQYTVGDSTGATSAPATVTVTVNAEVLGNPVAANLSYTAIQGVALVIPDAGSATDSTGSIDLTTVVITQPPSHGTANVDPASGDITYTATVGYSGPDSIQYTIADNLGAVSPAATITLTVAPTGPVVSNSTTAASANGANTINVISSASDASGNITPSGVKITAQPAHGTAAVDSITGSIIYTPIAGYLGADSLHYTLTDSNNDTSSPATLSLNVGVAINNSNAKSLAFVDNFGNKVTVVLTGGGTGEVFFNGTGSAQNFPGRRGTGSVLVTGTGLSISNITVSGSSMTGTLTISRKGTASVLLGGLSVAGAIGKIVAPTTTLTGTLAVTGAVTLLQLASASGATITVGSAGATRAGFSFTSGHVVNTSLASTAPIKSIKEIDWTVSGATDSITAPSIASLVTTGNFQAGVTTTGGSPFAMASARIGGQLDAEAWNITGATNSLVVASIAPGWVGNFSQPLKTFTIRGGGFAGTLNAASINSLSITGDDTGKIRAGSIRSARINGQLSGASITLTNPVAPKVTSLGRLTVTGATLNSKIVSAGNIGAISTAGISRSSVDAGTAPGVTLPNTGGNFIASATISSFSVVGAGSRFTSTNIGAQIIGSLNLGTITTSNNGHPFGVGAVTINSLSALLDIGGVLRMNRTALASSGSISAYLAAHSVSLGDFEIAPGL